MPDGEVTLAVLSNKIDTVIEKLDDLAERQQIDHDRISVNEGEILRLKDRQSIYMGVQTAIAAALSAIAGYIGIRK